MISLSLCLAVLGFRKKRENELNRIVAPYSTYINFVGSQLLQALVDGCDNLVCCVVAVISRINDLGRQSEAILLPACLACEAFLGPLAIHSRRINLIVSASLQKIQCLLEGVQVGDSATGGRSLVKGHETKNKSRLGSSHFASLNFRGLVTGMGSLQDENV